VEVSVCVFTGQRCQLVSTESKGKIRFKLVRTYRIDAGSRGGAYVFCLIDNSNVDNPRKELKIKNIQFESCLENFRDGRGKAYLVRCPFCGRENYTLAVAVGVCVWCGWSEVDSGKWLVADEQKLDSDVEAKSTGYVSELDKSRKPAIEVEHTTHFYWKDHAVALVKQLNKLKEFGFTEISGTEANVCKDIGARQKLGIEKYGQTVSENPLEVDEWLQHAYEEALDLAIYLKRAIEAGEDASKAAYLLKNKNTEK